ncbi:hypothetical protein [Microcoleus sp. D3_18_C2]|uniref:hypothetical protein n=1 Tax=Microcoleus sp. D3_18_C2 TaxID=3055334 RepID=UPI002FD2CC1C
MATSFNRGRCQPWAIVQSATGLRLSPSRACCVPRQMPLATGESDRTAPDNWAGYSAGQFQEAHKSSNAATNHVVQATQTTYPKFH